MPIDLSSKCRTCLSDSNFFHNLFDYVDENYKIVEMLDGIVPQINIKCNTQFSTLVCQSCVDKLLTGYKFQQLCIETNNRIHGVLDKLSFERENKFEKLLDPLTGETNLNMKQEVEDNVCYEQEITPDELEKSIRSDNDGDWEPPASSGSDSKEMLTFQCLDCLKYFEKKAALSAHYKVHGEKHDNKLLYNGKKVDTITKVDKIEIPETENCTEDNEPRECVKEEYEITPQIFKETMDESETNGELFSNNSEDSDDESDKSLFVKPVKSIKDVNLRDTTIAKLKKRNSKSRNCPCEVCGKVFYSPFNLKRHSSIHETITLDQRKTSTLPYSFKCPDCPRRFEKQSYLSKHRLIHYSEYLCMVCQRYFTTLRRLTIHINDKHPEFERYKCNKCEKTFVLHDLLVKHLNLHKDNSNFVCLVCKQEFGSANGLTLHMRTHSGYGNTLTDHMRTPSGESLHLCPHCGKTFTKEAHLRQHLPRHSEFKTYLCPECPMRFNIRSDLIKHALTHTNDKPHVCDICGTRFTRASSMRKHKLKHSGERPFKCDQCSMTFAIAYNLKGHMRTHTGEKPYKCKYCERAFSQSSDLTKHLRTHVGENIYMCDQCPMAFKYQAELKQHQADHYKMAKKLLQQKQQMPDEVQQQEIIDNECI